MPFQFPINPVVGQVFNPTPGVTYRWDGFGWVPVASGFLTTGEGDFRYIQWTNLYAPGDIHLSLNSTDPALKFGGVWDLISSGRVLLGASPLAPGSIGGVSEVTLSQANLPAVPLFGATDLRSVEHSHGYSDIYHDGTTESPAFTTQLPPSYGSTATAHAGSNTGGMVGGDPHSHNVTVQLNGSSQPINIMPPYFAVFVWRKIS